MNLNAFLVAPALKYWFLHNDWHLHVFGWGTEQAYHLLGINAFNSLLSQQTEDTLIQSNIDSMHFSYPFDLFQQCLD